jgi:hypothetical protein
MASSYTTRGRFTLQATGENNNTWGNILNSGVFQLVDDAIFGTVSFALSGVHALTTVNGATEEARFAVINVTGGTGGQITLPAVSKLYTVRNASSGQVQIGVAASPMAMFQPGEVGNCYCDGATTYRVRATDFGGHTLTGLGVPINPTDACTRAYADNLAFNSISLPGQPGNAGKYLKTDGTNPAWVQISGGDIAPLSITTGLLADGLITTPKLGAQVVTAANIANGAVGTPQIAANSIKNGMLADTAFNVTAPAGAAAGWGMQNSDLKPRWAISKNAGAETGANVGSDFSVDRYSDAGAYLGTPLFINRSNGGVTVAGSLAVNGSAIFLSGPVATYRTFYLQTAGQSRWGFTINNAAEAGGNAGSNFTIDAFGDSGAYITSPIQITRASGVVTFSASPLANGLFQSNGPNGSARGMQLYTSGSLRWNVICDSSNEGGGNNGSTFYIQRFTDAGAYIDSPLQILRANGQVWIGSLVVSANASVNGTLNTPNPITAGNPNAIAGNWVLTGFFQSGAWYNAQMAGVNVNNTTGILSYGSGQNMQWSNGASDRLRKANIKEPTEDPLAIVRNLPVWSCDYAPEPASDDPEWAVTPEHWPFSFMADEVDAVMPHATINDIEDSRPVALHPHHLVAVLWAAVQQLTAKVEALEAAR